MRGWSSEQPGLVEDVPGVPAPGKSALVSPGLHGATRHSSTNAPVPRSGKHESCPDRTSQAPASKSLQQEQMTTEMVHHFSEV